MSQTAIIQIYDTAANFTQSAISVTYTAGGTSGKFVQLGNFSGLTSTRPCIMNFNGAGLGYITASAEL